MACERARPCAVGGKAALVLDHPTHQRGPPRGQLGSPRLRRGGVSVSASLPAPRARWASGPPRRVSPSFQAGRRLYKRREASSPCPKDQTPTPPRRPGAGDSLPLSSGSCVPPAPLSRQPPQPPCLTQPTSSLLLVHLPVWAGEGGVTSAPVRVRLSPCGDRPVTGPLRRRAAGGVEPPQPRAANSRQGATGGRASGGVASPPSSTPPGALPLPIGRAPRWPSGRRRWRRWCGG